MTTEICTAADILHLNKTKEFTLTATCLLEALLTDPQLLAESSKLWQILFNRARFNENLEVKISYRELASILGKSIRSICRYITDLVQHNYLSIQNNYLVNDGQTVNSIFVRFPKKAVATALQNKDRLKSDVPSDTTELNTNLASDTHGSQVKLKSYNKNKHGVLPNAVRIVAAAINRISSSTDKVDNGLADNFVVANNSIDYEYKITNNTGLGVKPIVVDINSNKSEQTSTTNAQSTTPENQLASLQQQLNTKKQELMLLKQSLETLQQRLSSTTDSITRFDLMRKFTEYDALVHVETHTIERLEKTLVIHEQRFSYSKELHSNSDYINQQLGNRKLSAFTLKRLQHELQENGYYAEQQTLLMNEIVHEVRFGSLVQSNKTQQQLPIEHAVNIALKLVREKRWVTPAALGYKVESHDFNHRRTSDIR